MKQPSTSTLRLSVVALLLAQVAQVSAQTPNPPAAVPRPDRAGAEERRQVATALLIALADEAQGYQDHALEVRVSARAADALWPTERARARLLFRRAWTAAQTADEESARQTAELRRQRTSGAARARLSLIPPASNLRNEVLGLVARRDRALADEFFAALAAAPALQPAHLAPADPMDASLEVKQRLTLAHQLLTDGDTERALQFADPVLAGPVNVFVAHFLDRLRNVAAAAADERYARLLARLSRDQTADANSVALLSAYVASPFTYVTFAPTGAANSQQWEKPAALPELAPRLRAAFCQAAAVVLLRPLAPADEDRTSAGRAGLYMVITRLLPLFQTEAPDWVAQLEARRAALLTDTPERMRSNSSLKRGLAGDETQAARGQADEERLNTMGPGAARDALIASLALAAPPAQLDAARARAERIDDAELRRQIVAFLDFEGAWLRLRARDIEGVVRSARAGTLTPFQLVWLYTEAARAAARTDAAHAQELLADAGRAAERIEAGTPARAHAFVALADSTCEIIPARCWEATAVAVRAANSAAAFTGEGARVEARVETDVVGAVDPVEAPAFNLPALFARLGAEDLYLAIAAGRSLTGEAARATALLAVGRAVLAPSKDTKKGGPR